MANLFSRQIADKKNPYYSNLVANVTVVVGAEAGNAINVALQLVDRKGRDITASGAVRAYLSDDAAGASLAASAPSGGWAIGTDGLLLPIVANKYAELISESDGDIDITITESSAKTFYLVVILPSGKISVTPVTFV